jgi:methylated-DNA-[protein]-cysteine S-methyltransferase
MASRTTVNRPVSYAVFDTALGVWGLAWDANGLLRLQLPGRDTADTTARLTQGLAHATVCDPTGDTASAVQLLRQYAVGVPVEFNAFVLNLSAEPAFHQTVYAALRQVPRGQTTTYGKLAVDVGAPGAAQAIGQAMGRNPLPVIVPCHRVLAQGRKMGGFSAPGGIATKDQLLQLEGVVVGHGTPLLPGLFADRP